MSALLPPGGYCHRVTTQLQLINIIIIIKSRTTNQQTQNQTATDAPFFLSFRKKFNLNFCTKLALFTSPVRTVRVRLQATPILNMDTMEVRGRHEPRIIFAQKKASSTHSTVGWMGPRDGASVLEKQQNVFTLPCLAK